MAESEPCPTRKCVFKWDPYPNTLQISKLEGQAHQVTWIGLRQVDGPKDTSEQQSRLDKPMLPDSAPSALPDKSVDFEEGEIDEELFGSEDCDVAGEYSREVVEPFLPPPEPSSSSFDYSMAFPESDEVRSISAEALKSNPRRSLSTLMVRVDLAVEDLNLARGEASNHQELVIFSNTMLVLQSQASSLRMLEVSKCGEEPLSPLTCEPLAIVEPSVQDGANVGSIPVTGRLNQNG